MWKSFSSSLVNMFDFNGRERRRAFWFTFFFSIIILAVPVAVIGITTLIQTMSHKTIMAGKTGLIIYEQAAFAIVALLLYFPVVSCAVRRLHDVNVSGFLLAIPVVNIILLSLPTSLKEKKGSPGFVHALGQIFTLVIFIAAAGFSTLAFFSRKGGEGINIFSHQKEETLGEKALREIKETRKDNEKAVEKKEKPQQSATESDIHLLDAGAVIIPIYDTRNYNYIKIGSETLPDGSIATQYKHVQSLIIDLVGSADIYDTIDGDTVIGTINLGTEYTVLSLIQITHPQEDDLTGQFWLEVEYGKGSGFIFAGRIDNPYRNDNYEPIEQIQIGSKIWTVRKFDTLFSFYHQIDIRDNPGTEGTNIIGKIDANLTNIVTVKADAITEEDDTTDGPIGGEPWIRIDYDGIRGWIPGAYTDIEHGGVKCQTPNGILKTDMGVGI